MNAAQVRAKARMAVKRREEQIEQEEMEGGELNLVPYLDIVTNVMLFLLATITSGLILGNINSALPDYVEPSAGLAAPPQNPEEQSIQLVVAVTKQEIQVFSLSGLEGTLQAPKAKIGPGKKEVAPGKREAYDYAQLTSVALDIVKRHWPNKGDRPEATEEVILMADPDVPYSVIVATMDALRQAPDGTRLFPAVLFSTGIQ